MVKSGETHDKGSGRGQAVIAPSDDGRCPRMIYNSETKYKAIKAVESGAALRVATAKLGVSAETVRRWCKAVGSSFTVGLMGGAVLPRTQKPKS